ncbi:P-loop containing nucleoside triphosphate hydrolase protein [Hypoxylon crocopeplum]|nr:P-loop containing nucleoside triphosphate hydrolase protein [Hypoxylon crocopeplum]
MQSNELPDKLFGMRDEDLANKATQPEMGDDPRLTKAAGGSDKDSDEDKVSDEDDNTTKNSSAAETEDIVDPEIEGEIGYVPEVKHFYAEKNPQSGKVTYQGRLPAGGIDHALRNVQEGELTKKYAIIHYHRLSGRDLATDWIAIWSPEIKRHLADVLSGYPNVEIGAPRLLFRLPFVEFLHRWDRLLQMEETASNKRVKQLLRGLRRTLAADMKQPFQALDDFQKTGYIDFQNILVPFVPGEVMLRSHDGVRSAAILKAAYVETSFTNQKYCNWRFMCFVGMVVDLPVTPLNAYPNQEEIRRSLVERGRSFESLCGQHIKKYNGHVRKKYEGKIALSERIIIDTKAYYRFQQMSVPPLKRAEVGHLGNLPAIQDSVALSEEQCMLAPPKVKGFAISSKAWYKFNVNDISPVVWNDRFLGNLVIPEQEKEMLLALVTHAAEGKIGGFDDFLEGKGKGLIVLLAGPPGVGKTLTVESIAEELKRPLYKIGAGDLGIRARDVESSLKAAFDRCSHWNAVLLIDEADVFLERRSSDALDRNELVSIFLTMLEYYQGILILTTNRTRGMDSAFESRIDIILTFDHLSQNVRNQIWSNFIGTLPPDSVDLGSSDFDSLSRWVINRRQIKSAVKTARIIALKQEVPLRLSHLEIVLNVRKRGSKLIDMQEGQWEIASHEASSSWFKWPWAKK